MAQIKVSCTTSYCTFNFLYLCHCWRNWQLSASHLIQLLILVSPSPTLSCFSRLLTWKILQWPSCFLPWTDTVFSMLPPSLLPALRVAIFPPRKLACVEPADCAQPLGNLCTMLSIPEARSRHTWPAWSRCGLGRIYFLGSSVAQVFSWRSATSAERSGTALPGCVASPGCFDFFSAALPCLWDRGFLMNQKNHLCFLTSQAS